MWSNENYNLFINKIDNGYIAKYDYYSEHWRNNTVSEYYADLDALAAALPETFKKIEENRKWYRKWSAESREELREVVANGN